MADRYCGNCGQELSDDARFCPSCGRPVHETAHVPTPEADVSVQPPPAQPAGGTAPLQEAQAPPRRSSTASKLLIGCAGLFVVLVLFVGCLAVLGGSGGGDGGESAAGSGGAGGSDVLDKPPTIVCEMGNLCDLGESTVTVTKADKTNFIATDMDNFEGSFVLIEFDYTYGGSQPATVEDYRWKLEDGEGRTYNYAFDPTSTYEIDKGRSLIYEEINPGTKRDGAIIFEVAPNAKDFTLRVRDLIRPQTSKRAEVYF